DGTTYALVERAPPFYDDRPMSLAAFDISGNMLWQIPLGNTAGNINRGVAVGDDGTVWVTGREIIWTISPTGFVRAQLSMPSSISNDVPYLALGHDNALYAAQDHKLTKISTDGTKQWEIDLAAFGILFNAQPRVRRDGSVIVDPQIV